MASIYLPGSSSRAPRLVCESTGSFGQTVGYAAMRHGMSADVCVPAGISPPG